MSTTPTQIYVRDIAAGTNRLATVNRFGTGGCNSACTFAGLSPDGRWVVFTSTATDLATNALPLNPNLFLRDLVGGTTEVLSTLPLNANPFNSSVTGYGPVFSANSRFVAFASTTLEGQPANRIEVRDLVAKTSRFAPGPLNTRTVRNPSVSANGRLVAYEGQATLSGIWDIFMTDLDSGTAKQSRS